ncbi:hypothetical protein JFV28_20525 [Pseudomonas sp. TH05]|uniref:hypothetical protein n=1 Tax=unclassified Pseudomonas TaxID=196821 RepID=UPI001914C69C|nr:MULTISPECIES: hypothetical protein [unclassified Pseudomonas]MBK5541490.1 hypothetical protein [Pseudomonas sp. TH07]MBK5558231.1 hypothetical protein [Pseudomonas sp. TH05]
MTFGINQHVYVSNNCSENVYVLACENPYWAIADFAFDVGFIVLGFTEIKAGIECAELPSEISKTSDLFKLLNVCRKIVLGTISAGSRPTEAAHTIIDQVMKYSVSISPNDHVDASSQDVLGMFLSPSGVAGMLGASTITLLIMKEGGKGTVMYNTNPDYSWISESDGIWRAKYGHLWVHQDDYPEYRW